MHRMWSCRKNALYSHCLMPKKSMAGQPLLNNNAGTSKFQFIQNDKHHDKNSISTHHRPLLRQSAFAVVFGRSGEDLFGWWRWCLFQLCRRRRTNGNRELWRFHPNPTERNCCSVAVEGHGTGIWRATQGDFEGEGHGRTRRSEGGVARSSVQS